MAEGKKQKTRQKPGEAPYEAILECVPAEDAEDRLLRVYALLLGIPEAPETDLEAQK